MGVFYGAYQKWGGGAGPQLWKKFIILFVYFHSIRLKVTLACSYKSTCLLKLRILMTMTTITITTRQAFGLCPLATAESSTTTSTTRLSIPSTSLTGIRCPTSFYDLWESSVQGIYEATESYWEKSSEDRPLYLNKYKKKMCNECCFSIKTLTNTKNNLNLSFSMGSLLFFVFTC